MKEFSEILVNNGITDKTDLIKANYGLEVLKNEFLKFIFMSLIFFFMESLTQFIFAFLMLAPIRVFSGGFHMPSKLLCQVFSLAIFILAILLLPSLTSNTDFYYIMQIFSIVITIIASPVINKSRPIKTRKRYVNMKIKTSIFILSNSLILLLFSLSNNFQLYYIGVWVIILNTLQLFISWIRYKWKGETHEFSKKSINKNDISGRHSMYTHR